MPYERRGRVLSIIELPWSLSWFIGVPATGFLIAAVGWRTPFWLIAGLGIVSLLATLWLCPDCGRRRTFHTATAENGAPRQRPAWASPTVYVALAVSFLVVLANENVFVVYGAWLETQFGLTVAALGVASLVISAAELIGEGAAAAWVDRLGKRRAVLAGLLLGVLSFLLLPRLAGALGTALAGVFLMFLTFEFSIVGLLPLVSELAPEARGTVMALNIGVMSLGRMISSLLAPRLWRAGGLPLNALVSAGVVLLAALILWRGVREKRGEVPA